jgi:Domain of unknown function (DUF1707)
MSGDLVRASDSDRERAVLALREHLAAGRLTLEEFTERMSVALAAATTAQLEPALRELPATAPMRRKPTRFVPALFSSTRRDGRMRVRRRVLCLVGFGNVDLDLREASFEGDVVTVIGFAAFSALDVYVPEGVEVDLHGLTVFGHKRARGKDVPPLPGTPLVRVYTFGMFSGIDVWRTAERGSIRQVIRSQRELER